MPKTTLNLLAKTKPSFKNRYCKAGSYCSPQGIKANLNIAA